ncbi:hypothetical protein ACMC9K_00955 [Pseudomonadota bacterium DY0742]|uniref:hypothetical protein n=1 Tax=Stutzerimonas balearica TaxID=74829 RepID=UPI001BC96EC9|nr:hypothetical protein [Stutzerimonas balearica]MBS4150141.1 hypothetical protein [Stutzerimonas balearica]
MKKWQKSILIASVPLVLSGLIIRAFFENYSQDNIITASAFKEHYIPFTKKGEECLALDRELQQQSLLLAGTMALARKELNKLVHEDFHITSDYEPIIKSSITSFSETQDTHGEAFKKANSCWVDLKRIMEETAVAAGVYKEFKEADPQMVSEEGVLNKDEQELRARLIDPIDGERLYDGLTKLLTTQKTQEMKSILKSFDREFGSLVKFRAEMVGLTGRRVALREKFYISKKDLFAQSLSSSISSGFFFKTIWPF